LNSQHTTAGLNASKSTDFGFIFVLRGGWNLVNFMFYSCGKAKTEFLSLAQVVTFGLFEEFHVSFVF
jgi:hypothetical protein